jgi:hypothetical protein
VPAAKPLTTDAAIIEPACALVSARAGMLRPLHKALQRLDQAIALAMDEHPYAAIFRSFPGAGPALAPRLLVAFGTNRNRFASAAEVAQFYPERFAQEALGHNSNTVHRAYAKNAEVPIDSLDEWEQKTKEKVAAVQFASSVPQSSGGPENGSPQSNKKIMA